LENGTKNLNAKGSFRLDRLLDFEVSYFFLFRKTKKIQVLAMCQKIFQCKTNINLLFCFSCLDAFDLLPTLIEVGQTKLRCDVTAFPEQTSPVNCHVKPRNKLSNYVGVKACDRF
jgi:hypothetical protein